MFDGWCLGGSQEPGDGRAEVGGEAAEEVVDGDLWGDDEVDVV